MTNPAMHSDAGGAVWKPPRWSLFFRMREFTDMPWRTRARVHWRANVRLLQSAEVVMKSTLISLIPTLCFALLVWWTEPLKPGRIRHGDLTALMIIAGAVVVAWLVTQHLCFIYVLNRFYAPFVRREFAAMGMPMCPACGQRLADASVARCSECGTRLESIGS